LLILIRVLALVRGVPWVLTYSDFFARLRVEVALARVVVFFAVNDVALVAAFLVVVDFAAVVFAFAFGLSSEAAAFLAGFAAFAGAASATSSNETKWATDLSIPRTDPESAFSTDCPIFRSPKVRKVSRCCRRVPIWLRVCLIRNMVF
jgi:hypothetical protein